MANFWEESLSWLIVCFICIMSTVFVILDVYFDFEGGTLVLIASVPGHRLPLIFVAEKVCLRPIW